MREDETRQQLIGELTALRQRLAEVKVAETERKLERRVAELSALSAMASIVNESLEVDDILNRAMDEALRLVGVEAAAMMLLDEEAGELVMAAHRGISDEFAQAFSRMKLGEGMSGQVAQTGQAAVLRDLAEYPEARRSYLEAEKIRSAAAVPLMGRTGLVGTMNLGTASPEYFDAEGLDLLVSLGRQVAIGVDKAHLYAAVRQSQERLHYLVSSSPAVIYTSQAYGDYGATFISENVNQQMGYESQEYIQDSGFWAAHIHPDDAPRIFDGLPRLFEHGHHTHEYRFLCKDGTYRWMRDEMKLVRDADGNPVEIVGYWIDITERVQAEEELRRHRDHLEELVAERTAELVVSEERFRNTFEQAPIGIAHVSPGGQFLRINRYFCDIVGYTRGEMTDLTFQEITYPDDLEADLAYVQQTLSGEMTSYSMEKRYVRKDGLPVWVNLTVSLVRKASGEPDYFIAAVQDVSARKRAEKELLLKDIAFESSIAANSIADNEGIITHVNPAFLSLWGYETVEDAIGNSVSSFFVDPNDATPVIEALNATGRWEGEFLAQKRDGTTFLSRGLATAIFNENGEQIGYQSANLDVTAEKQAEQELARRVAELERFNHLMVGREQRMIELKRQVNALSEELGRKAPYDTSFAE